MIEPKSDGKGGGGKTELKNSEKGLKSTTNWEGGQTFSPLEWLDHNETYDIL